jgi:para-nitrobenzyl esterase
MIGYWIRFAARGDPNGDGAPAWPRYSSTADLSLELDVPAQAREAMYSDVSDFFDHLLADHAAESPGGKRGRSRH